MRKFLLAVCVLIPAMPALAQQDHLKLCGSSAPPDVIVANCTKFLEAERSSTFKNAAVRQAVALYNRARALSDTGQPARALADLDEAILLHPDFAHGFDARGTAHARKGDFDRALADFNAAIRIDPKFALAYFNRGIMHRDKGDLDLAIADFSEAFRLDPKDARALLNRGLVYRMKGETEKAEADRRAAMRIDPNL